MATKSIYKNVTINNEKSGRSLAEALEKSRNAVRSSANHNMPNRVAKHDIKSFLGKVVK